MDRLAALVSWVLCAFKNRHITYALTKIVKDAISFHVICCCCCCSRLNMCGAKQPSYQSYEPIEMSHALLFRHTHTPTNCKKRTNHQAYKVFRIKKKKRKIHLEHGDSLEKPISNHPSHSMLTRTHVRIHCKRWSILYYFTYVLCIHFFIWFWY